MLRFLYSTAVCHLALLLSLSTRVTAEEPLNHAALLAPFVNADSFAALYADVASIKLSKDAPSQIPGLAMIDGFAKRFRDAGGQALYALAGLGDLHIGGGPVVIATARPGQSPDKLEELLKEMIKEITDNPTQKVAWPFLQKLAVQRKGDVVLVGMKATVARYAQLPPSARHDLIEPLTKLSGEGAVGAAVFCPGPDFRRVVRELWPELPGVLAPLRGELADRWLHVEAAVNLLPDIKPRLAIQTTDPAAANLFVKLWHDLPTATTEFGGNPKSQAIVKGYAQLLIDTLPAKVEDTRVVFRFPTDAARVAKLQAMFGEAADASRESARRKQRANQFKQLCLAMHNYHDVHKRFPPAAIRDKDGKPLLSWRVAILPYLEEDKLYKQFHLDEPWDSPHNRALIEKMPDAYADPDLKLKQAAREGRTTYQVPVGPGTVFGERDGISLKEIADGTSRTIVVVEVEPQRAVVWTKPEDWEVDEANPRRGIERKDRERFIAGYGDGHVKMLPVNIDEQTLKGLLTRAGREVVNEP